MLACDGTATARNPQRATETTAALCVMPIICPDEY
jgi:hypothetical protein